MNWIVLTEFKLFVLGRPGSFIQRIALIEEVFLEFFSCFELRNDNTIANPNPAQIPQLSNHIHRDIILQNNLR
jgi:hypothetical protein